MKKPTADEALQELMAGNQRYVSAQRAYPHQTSDHRTAVAKRQQPFAVILGCSDSRVPPEIVFDQGLGSVIRAIKPAVESARSQPGDLLPNSIKAHVQMVVGRLRTSQPVLAKLVKGEKLRIPGAYYHLRTGVVDLIA